MVQSIKRCAFKKKIPGKMIGTVRPVMGFALRRSAGRPVVVLSQQQSQLRFFSASEKPSTVSLVYDLHEPAKPQVPDKQTSPIIFMHGLFGSKKNNRSISK